MWILLGNIWENRISIFQGLKNRLFTSKDIRILADKRLSWCNRCIYNSANGGVSPYRVPYKHCIKCGCSLHVKPYSESAECPIGLWD